MLGHAVGDAAGPARRQQAKRSFLGWHDPSFFGGFSAGESTYDEEADFGRQGNYYLDGWEPGIRNPYEGSKVAAQFFHESPSGGVYHAWQTHFPPGQTGLVSQGANPGAWVRNSAGSWTQRFLDSAEGMHATDHSNIFNELKGTHPIAAGWFDSSVQQTDALGRIKAPSPLSPKRYITWHERSVNTTLSCVEPGCSATSSLQAFDGTHERARHCRLNVYVKPTDYDEQYSGERVEWISVNDVTVSLNCEPLMSGCNATAQRPYFPCVMDLNLDKLMPSSGTLQLAAKIPQVVDECPYRGSLLYAVPVITCLVTEQPMGAYRGPNYPPRGVGGAPSGHQEIEVFANGTIRVIAPLKCPERGCTASTVMVLNYTAASFSDCRLTVRVNLTDYDNLEWSTPTELIEFVKVEGTNVSSNLNPGKNPCRARYAGTPLPPREMQQTLVDSADVTANSGDGVLMVEAKISGLVDECASGGNLFDGMAEVVCAPGTAVATLLQQDSDLLAMPNEGAQQSG